MIESPTPQFITEHTGRIMKDGKWVLEEALSKQGAQNEPHTFDEHRSHNVFHCEHPDCIDYVKRYNKNHQQNEPQLSAEQKKEWVVKTITKWMSESQEGMAIHVLSNYVNTELATALEEQRLRYISDVSYLTQYWDADGEKLCVDRSKVMDILN